MNSKAWRVSASVIIALRAPIVRDSLIKGDNGGRPCKADNTSYTSLENNNLHVISVRRGESDKHLPGIHVFPGGHLEEADTSNAWIDLFRSFGFEENSFLSLSTGGSIEHMPEYIEPSSNSTVPGWMSLRLCAIRETFEESGILLCRNPSGAGQSPPFASSLILNELAVWQSRVRADPRQMLALCHAAGCVPDLWGLHLWSNWLTPTQQRTRHNSVFFLSVLPLLPPYSLDKSEMDELKCWSPSDIMDGACSRRIRLANPQFYEVSRLLNFKDVDSLASFASSRSQLGCSRTMPVQYKIRDGMVFILPGDSAYPKNIDYVTPCNLIKREESFKMLREQVVEKTGTLHRIEVPVGSSCQRVVAHNYVAPYEHVLPTVFHLTNENLKSQM